MRSHVRGMMQLAGWMFVLISIVWSCTACDPSKQPRAKSSASAGVVVPLPPRNRSTPTPSVAVSPGQDPNPQAYAAMPITATCGWAGHRWITMLVTVNNKPLSGHPREFKYDDNADTIRSQTFEAKPGDAIGLDCKPMVDQSRYGRMECTLTWFKTILQPGGYMRKQNGDARCYAQLPMRA